MTYILGCINLHFVVHQANVIFDGLPKPAFLGAYQKIQQSLTEDNCRFPGRPNCINARERLSQSFFIANINHGVRNYFYPLSWQLEILSAFWGAYPVYCDRNFLKVFGKIAQFSYKLVSYIKKCVYIRASTRSMGEYG